MLISALLFIGACITGCAAALLENRDQPVLPPLYEMSGEKPILSINDILNLTNLPPSSDWFTAALIAAVNSGAGTPNWLTNGNAIRQINSTAAAYSLYAPGSPEETQVVIDVRTLPVMPPWGVPWWAAGYMEAMRRHGPFKYGYNGPTWVGAFNNGTWSPGVGLYGFQFLRLGQGYVFQTNDTAKIRKIAQISAKIPVTVMTTKGLVTDSKGPQGDLSAGMKEYALLGLKADGAILLKGRANRLEENGMIPDPDDLAKNAIMFSAASNILGEIGL